MHYSTTKENRWEGGATNLWKRGKGTCLSRERCDEWLNAKGDGLTGEDLFKLNIITEILYYEIPQGSIIGPLLFSVFTNHFLWSCCWECCMYIVMSLSKLLLSWHSPFKKLSNALSKFAERSGPPQGGTVACLSKAPLFYSLLSLTDKIKLGICFQRICRFAQILLSWFG